MQVTSKNHTMSEEVTLGANPTYCGHALAQHAWQGSCHHVGRSEQDQWPSTFVLDEIVCGAFGTGPDARQSAKHARKLASSKAKHAMKHRPATA